MAKALHYEPNKTAIFFKEQRTYSIGVILPNLKEEFFSRAISGIEDIAKQHKYHVFISQSHDDADTERDVVLAMKDKHIDGLIVSLSKHTKSYDHFLSLKKYNIPVVFFDRVPDGQNVNKVAFNMVEGTKRALEFLLKKGHRRIGVINGPEEMTSSKERTEAYKQVMIKNRIKIDMSLIENTDLSPEMTASATQRLLSLKPRPTAILTINDYVALDSILQARELGFDNKQDISFISYVNLPITRYLENPPMASVEQFPYQQGATAAQILFNVMNKDVPQDDFNHILIDGEIVVHYE